MMLAPTCDACQRGSHGQCAEFYWDADLWQMCRCPDGGHPWDEDDS